MPFRALRLAAVVYATKVLARPLPIPRRVRMTGIPDLVRESVRIVRPCPAALRERRAQKVSQRRTTLCDELTEQKCRSVFKSTLEIGTVSQKETQPHTAP